MLLEKLLLSAQLILSGLLIIKARLEIVSDVHLFPINIVILVHVMPTFLVVFLHFPIIHLHDLFEDFGGVDTHLLRNLENLRIQLLEINVIEVDLVVFIFFLLLIVLVVLVIAIIIFVHLSQLLLEAGESSCMRRRATHIVGDVRILLQKILLLFIIGS